jgi:hypothetical protein
MLLASENLAANLSVAEVIYRLCAPAFTAFRGVDSTQPLASKEQRLLAKLAGVAGFEPTNGGIKTRCLTTWRHPNTVKRKRA